MAIGSRLGRNYACTYMRQWDDKLAKFKNQPMLYYRFIDDGFGIWLHVEESQGISKILKQHTSDINVELRYSSGRIEFLDTMIILENEHIITDLYTKPICRQEIESSIERQKIFAVWTWYTFKDLQSRFGLF